MKRFFLLLSFTALSLSVLSQSETQLVAEINSAKKSFNDIEKILTKYNKKSYTYIFDTIVIAANFFLVDTDSSYKKTGIKKFPLGNYFFEDYFRFPLAKPDKSGREYSSVGVTMIYNKDEVVYLFLIKFVKWDTERSKPIYDTLYRYISNAYLENVLKPYNASYQTDFTWRDLFEDSCYDFSVVPGCCGSRMIAEEMDPFIPMLLAKDKAQIVKNCKSFNPYRKAYGALCLYYLKKEGVKLTDEEILLLETSRCSDELIAGSNGCLGFTRSIAQILNDNSIEGYYRWLKDFL